MSAQALLKQRYSPFDSNKDKIKPTGWIPILAFVIAEIIYVYIINTYIFPSRIWKSIFEATRGLVNPTLAVNLAGIVIIGIGVILIFGKLKKEDIGIRWNLLPRAVLITLVVWAVAQLIGAIISFITTGSLQLDSEWNRRGLLAMLGILIGQIIGNAFLEEIAFRGFLLPQLYFKIKCLWLNQHKWTRAVIVLILSQAIFVCMHIPNRLGQGLTPFEWIVDFSSVFILGILFAFIYLRTGNLFIAIGVHAFINAPASLFISGDISKWLIAALGIVIIVFWPKIQSMRIFSGQRRMQPIPLER